MLGTLVATFAFTISIFAPSIPVLILTYGFLGGECRNKIAISASAFFVLFVLWDLLKGAL